MPLLMGTKGSDILKWRASAELISFLKGGFALQWERSSARETETFLGTFIGSLEEELSYEVEFLRETSALDEAIGVATTLGELSPLTLRYREVIAAYFRRRESILALIEYCNRLHDRVLAKALSLAEERMLQTGQGSAPVYALLVCGDRGRKEETLQGENHYFLLHEQESPRFILFSRQLAAAFLEAGLIGGEQLLWHGSLAQWRSQLAGSSPAPFSAPAKQGAPELPEWEASLEALTDLCFIQGYAPLADQALDAARATVARERRRDPFLQLARRVVALPLAQGRFGRWRSERTGEHQGEVNLHELALRPLVMTVRVLAVQEGVGSAGTLERIQALQEKGALDVELTGRLLKAYQRFMQLKIQSEMRKGGSGTFYRPEQFDETGESRLKESFEAVLNLQKITYQKMVG